MVDVDRHMGGLTPAHAAGLRRLSARASAAPTSSTAAVSHHGGLLSFRPLAESVLARLRAASVPIRPGLSDAEVSRLEADLAVSFPPDLRAILVLGLPSAPGFPDWRPSSSCTDLLLRASLDVPLAAASLQVARGALWPRSWGPRPSDPDRALGVARAALRRSPFLIPVFDRCYIPSRPCLAGNPIFYVDEHRVFCCGFDLADFFQREPAFPPASRRDPHPISSSDPLLPPPPPPPARRSLDAVAGRTPRWIEFWSDAASDRRRRNSSSSASSSSSGSASPRLSDPQRSVDIRSQRRLPGWVDCYLDQIGSVLRSSGWGESDVIEIVGVPPSRFFDGDVEASTAAAIDSEAALDALLVNADRCSQSLRRAGWSPDEVSDALGFDSLRREGRRERPPMELPPEIAAKVEKLAEAVATS
ncbi:unnamed protein product [Musa acuminata subsp. malaccensis]|uniref:(wild Malaysian banana) hypothetical protein n=1 Tax=Musa acuminata subsp. malaccensis TaxID=214687 RepID=A0A804KJL6_MUSAM|nr:PREDICTED: uncharacterized protein LOC103997994 [Musa acuminata subsp. malaccensis]CAG1835203.1 unnamed protein product [Musa acuminata subsp. malaccensis]